MLGRKKKHGWVALRLQAQQVDVARVERGGDRPRLVALDSFRREGADVATLERLRREFKLSQYRCIALLGPGEYQMLQVEAPAVDDAELREALRWRVKDLLDFPAQEATLDVAAIPGEAGGRAKQVFAVAAANSLVGARMQCFHEAHLALEVIDIPEMAQRNVAALLEDENRGLALLAFDASGGLLTLTYGGELYASRRIEITADQLREAETLVRSGYLERIALELQRSLDHFDRQYGFISLSRLLVTPIAGVEELVASLAANLYLPVEALDLARVLDLSPVPELSHPERQGRCLQVIGAALRSAGAPA